MLSLLFCYMRVITRVYHCIVFHFGTLSLLNRERNVYLYNILPRFRYIPIFEQYHDVEPP